MIVKSTSRKNDNAIVYYLRDYNINKELWKLFLINRYDNVFNFQLFRLEKRF